MFDPRHCIPEAFFNIFVCCFAVVVLLCFSVFQFFLILYIYIFYPDQYPGPYPFYLYRILNRQFIFGFPQYEPIPIHLDPFHLNFDLHLWSGGGPESQSLGRARRQAFEMGQTPDQLRTGKINA